MAWEQLCATAVRVAWRVVWCRGTSFTGVNTTVRREGMGDPTPTVPSLSTHLTTPRPLAIRPKMCVLGERKEKRKAKKMETKTHHGTSPSSSKLLIPFLYV
eukprot:Hpha_TRINITY_DN16456_c0_g2::TRINITY_DN16456_c0_g2_i1::g.161872::m.161872